MQVKVFPQGGFVLHRVTLPGHKGRFSAWFDRERKLLDAEQILPTFDRAGHPKTRSVSPENYNVRDALSNVGTFIQLPTA